MLQKGHITISNDFATGETEWLKGVTTLSKHCIIIFLFIL